MSHVEENKRVVGLFFAALGRGDREGLAAVCREDLEWSVPQGAVLHAGTHRGAELVFDRMLSAAGDAFVAGSQRMELGLMAAEGEAVFVEARVHAKGANGRDYENVYVFVFEFEAGRIARLREHVDTQYAAGFFG